MRADSLAALALIMALAVAGCGGGSGRSRSATPTPGSGTVTPQTRTPTARTTPVHTATPGGNPSILPPYVLTARVIFRASNGEQCCVAADPALLPAEPARGQETLVLDDLPIGPATVTVAGYTTDFAPAPPGVTATCRTVNRRGVAPCDTTRNASPAYESDPLAITIFPGVRVNLGSVDVAPLPFVLTFTPPQNSAVPLPVDLSFTVVDPATGIAAPSVALEITLDVPQGKPPVFRPLTKRVELALDACRDGGSRPCSEEGDNGLTGFIARGISEFLAYLPAGPVAARITAQNLADPPRDLDFQYLFAVAPEPTPTAPPPAAAEADGDEHGAVVIVPSPTPTETPLP